MVAVTFAGFDEMRRHVGEAHMSRKWEQPLANSQQGPEILNPATRKELNAANNHIGSEADSSPGELLD